MSKPTESTETAPFERPAKLAHIAIRTRDLDATIAFYTRFAGLSVIHERVDEGIRVAWLADSAASDPFVIVALELPYEDSYEPSPTDHFGFELESREAVDKVGALAREQGNLKFGPADAGPIVGYIVLVRDPSGNTCEFSYGQSSAPS